jgi:ABC-type multidrug transport system ATPase subunit
MDEAERCQRLGFLSRGHLIALGTVTEVTRAFGQPSIEDVFIELQRRDEGKDTSSWPQATGLGPGGVAESRITNPESR